MFYGVIPIFLPINTGGYNKVSGEEFLFWFFIVLIVVIQISVWFIYIMDMNYLFNSKKEFLKRMIPLYFFIDGFKIITQKFNNLD